MHRRVKLLARYTISGIASCALALALVPVAPALAANTEPDVAQTIASEFAASAQAGKAIAQAAQANGLDPMRTLAASNEAKRRQLRGSAVAKSPKGHLFDTWDTALPSEYYLTNLGQVTTVKDQGTNANCWAYAGVGALESAVLKQQRGADSQVTMDEPVLTGLADASTDEAVPDYSEAHLTYYAFNTQTYATAGDQEGEGVILNEGEDAFSHGGCDQFAEALFTAQQGIVSQEVADEYAGTPESWNTELGAAHRLDTSDVFIKDMVYLDSPAVFSLDSEGSPDAYKSYDANATAAIKQALVDHSAVAIGINSKALSSQQDSSTYFSKVNCCQYNYAGNWSGAAPNHEVTIVGWDDAYPKGNFVTEPPRDGAWLCKNSWGDDWGIEAGDVQTGFFWLSYYDHSIEAPAAFAVEDADPYDNVHQYDHLATLSEWSYEADAAVTSIANVFVAGSDPSAPNGRGTDGAEELKAVSARTLGSSETVKVEVYLLSEESESPVDGRLACAESFEATHAGFHVLELNKPVKLARGQRYSIVETVSFEGEGGETYYETPVEASGGAYLKCTIKASDNTDASYIGRGSGDGSEVSWSTVASVNAAENSDETNRSGNTLIKAYTDNIAYTGGEQGSGEQDGGAEGVSGAVNVPTTAITSTEQVTEEHEEAVTLVKVAIKSVKAKGKKTLVVKWAKPSAGARKNITGYQVQVALNKKFKKGKKTVNVKGAYKKSAKVSKLKSKKKYYVRVRAYKVVDDEKTYGAWSKVLTRKTK